VVRWSRHSAGKWLVTAVLGVWLCSSVLVAPTTFAASARRHSSDSCGTSGGAQLAANARQSGTSIWLNQTLGTADTSLIISGTGWPGGTAVTIDAYGYNGLNQLVIGQTALVRATTKSNGTFQTAPFMAPTSATCTAAGAYYGQPGTVVFLRAHTGDNQVSAQARFLYQLCPELTTSSEIVQPGTTIPIAGIGWETGEWVTVTTSVTQGLSQAELHNGGAAQPSGELPIRVKADGPPGVFTTEVTVPGDLTPQNGFVVSATATGPVYGSITAPPLVFNIQPTKAPTLAANLAQGYPGTVVTLAGASWLAGTVLAEYCRGQTSGYSLGYIWPYVISHLDCYPPISQGLGTAPVMGGTFRIMVVIPENARPGPITIQVRTASDILPGVFVAAVPFTVLVPWQMVHPRLAQALGVGKVALPLLFLIGGAAGAVVLWQRRRRVRMGLVR
jgi:hypothetical protein